MKTAISLPDDLFRHGDALARRLHVSRSELYARALAEYVAKHRDDEVTRRLNEVYATQPARMDPGLARAAKRTIAKDPW